ncbi:MAG: bile acid:sodium symporter family protein [Candidatus Hydrogenedens sp.]|nr:bile acid:sodium symporter family protein [Candidatus Hydrogenedens sp.]
MESLDTARLSFSQDSMWILNICIGLIMFGVSLDLRPSDFVRVFRTPKAPVIGLMAQFFVLPAVTFALTMIFRPPPSVALGMMLVAACPGGNLSNFLTYLAKGNAALSITMSAVSTAAAIVMTPLNITFWGMRNPATEPLMREVSIDPWEILVTIVMILGVPLMLGMLVNASLPKVSDRLHKPFKIFSIVFFLLFVGVLFSQNWRVFLPHLGIIMAVVIGHNLTALSVGYGMARAGGLRPADRRAVAIEVGIQNSALGLALVFGFFDGMGGMAMVAGMWGIWHIISGLTLAGLWSRIDPEASTEQEAAA